MSAAAALGIRNVARRSSPLTIECTTRSVGSPLGAAPASASTPPSARSKELALGPARARRPDAHSRAPQLVTQGFRQAVHSVLTGHIRRGVRQPDEAQNGRYLEDLSAAAGLHVPYRPLGEVEEGHNVHLDDAANHLEVLRLELGIMADARVVHEQVKPAGTRFGPGPELRAKASVCQVTGKESTRAAGSSAASDSSRSALRAVAKTVMPRSRDELAHQLSSQTGRGARDECGAKHRRELPGWAACRGRSERQPTAYATIDFAQRTFTLHTCAGCSAKHVRIE